LQRATKLVIRIIVCIVCIALALIQWRIKGFPSRLIA